MSTIITPVLLPQYYNPAIMQNTQLGSILGSELTVNSDNIAPIINQAGQRAIARGVKTAMTGVLVVHFVRDYTGGINSQGEPTTGAIWRVVKITDTDAFPNAFGWFDFIDVANSTAGFFAAVTFPAIPKLEIML